MKVTVKTQTTYVVLIKIGHLTIVQKRHFYALSKCNVHKSLYQAPP